MAAHLRPLSPADFHALYDGAKPAFEYWYGDAVQKSMPTVLHGIVQVMLAILLDKAGWTTASEVRLKVVSDAEPVPDLIAIRGKFKGRYPTVAPALCIEIMFPDDTLARTLKKAGKYLDWGRNASGSSTRKNVLRGRSHTTGSESRSGSLPREASLSKTRLFLCRLCLRRSTRDWKMLSRSAIIT